MGHSLAVDIVLKETAVDVTSDVMGQNSFSLAPIQHRSDQVQIGGKQHGNNHGQDGGTPSTDLESQGNPKNTYCEEPLKTEASAKHTRAKRYLEEGLVNRKILILPDTHAALMVLHVYQVT